GDDAVGGEVVGRGVGQQRVFHERALVEQQRQPVAHEQLVLTGQLLRARREVALPGPFDRGPDLVAHARYVLRIARMATSSVSGASAKSRAASSSDLHSTSASTPGSRRRKPAIRSSPNISPPRRASASPSVYMSRRSPG